MAEKISSDFVIGLSSTEAAALTKLLDEQENLPATLNDLNNTLQTL